MCKHSGGMNTCATHCSRAYESFLCLLPWLCIIWLSTVLWHLLLCVCSTLCLPSHPRPRSAHQQDLYPTPQCSLAATAAASRLSAAAVFLKPQAPKPHPPLTMLSPPPPLVALMSFFGERTRLHPLTAAIRGDRCPSLTAFPFLRVLMLHPFHQNPTSFAVLSQWSSCPDPAPFPGKSLSFNNAGRKYHAPPIALSLFGVD